MVFKKGCADVGSCQAIIAVVLYIEWLNGDVATLHFIWEGADTFYVTRYSEYGHEIGGYNDLMTQQS